jgi:TRAP-type mannitol/chloroaromatic compound transport system permease small subunit
MQETSSTTWAPVLYPAKIMIAIAALTFTLQIFADLIHNIHSTIAEK